MPKLQNGAIERLDKELQTGEGHYALRHVCLKDMDYVWDNTPDDSKLRRLILDVASKHLCLAEIRTMCQGIAAGSMCEWMIWLTANNRSGSVYIDNTRYRVAEPTTCI